MHGGRRRSAGQRGFFSRDADGRVSGLDLGGRLFVRTSGAA
ncbi:hypothetical protein ACWGB8_14985 [Kitasatospora sp. NPDC054939]